MTSFADFIQKHISKHKYNENQILMDSFDVISDYVKKQQKIDVNYINEFKAAVNHKHNRKLNKKPQRSDICVDCNQFFALDKINSKFVCEQCGNTQPVILDQVHQNDWGSRRIPSYYNYNRSDHLIATLKKKKIDPTTIDLLVKLFKNIIGKLQAEYKKHDKTYINYNFIIHKLLIIIGRKNYCDAFPMLKSHKRLELHDKIWKTVIAQYNFNF